MKVLLSLIVFFFTSTIIWTQDLSGIWEGTLYQDDRDKTYYYQVQIEQNNGIIKGTSFSRDEETGNKAQFTLTGAWNGEQLVLQEIEQVSPPTPKWCLKYITLELMTGPSSRLEGRWKADGCRPGKLILNSPKQLEPQQDYLPETSFNIAGKWMGFLYQDDRNYGFYYEVDIDEGGEGTSYIVSEDNGGSAYIKLNWDYDPEEERLMIKETAVREKTDEKWPWCIKSAKLNLKAAKDRHMLEGDWLGYIEGHTQKSGACAPGKMLLERIIPSPEIKEEEKKMLPYEQNAKRKVKVERVVEVSSPNIRIKVWDNGIVDGDIVTIFLNGKQLLENHRVNKRKFGMNVQLNESTNFLILHAEDLGDITPNTVAVSIDDGQREQVIILSSNLRESGAVMIKEFKVD